MATPALPRAVAVVVLLAATSSCGSRHLSTTDQRVAESLADYAINQSNGVWNKVEANCMATKFVKSAGVPALKEARLVTATGKANPAKVTLPRPLATDFADAVMACVDFADLSARQIAAVRPDIDSAAFASCVRKEVSKEAARDRLVAQQMNNPNDAAYEQTNKLMLACAEQSTSP